VDREARARAADEAAQERTGAAPGAAGALSPGRVAVAAGMHPDHGEPVMFLPGELLPAWAVAALVAQRPDPDEHGVYRLEARPKRKGGRP
jgi:hypothetical protein